ncbi:MAG: DUF6036 family nucleotidyltransferase [Pyrinomonadaceae bacterium]
MAEPFSMIETLRDFVKIADNLRIKYMVTGSFAMSAFGEIRTTRDVDIVVQLSEKHILPLTKAFDQPYYINESSIRRALDNRSMFNIVNSEWGTKIDCIIQKDTDFARQSFERRRRVVVSEIPFWTTTKEDLIVAKLNWARDTHSEMQIRDIANLTSNEYDAGYVRRWIDRMELTEIWAEVERWKTLHLR